MTAPFTGRIGARQVSIGGLIAGSRAASSPTTLLATLVSLDPIYLDFDMSEQEYLTFQRQRQKQGGSLDNKVEAALSDETDYGYQGAFNFLDNSVNRSSGTISRARHLQEHRSVPRAGAIRSRASRSDRPRARASRA